MHETPVRIVTNPERGKNGLFIQPRDFSPERETVEQHNRDRAAAKADYADPYTGNTRTFDPHGDYRCGTCNQEDKADCLLVVIQQVDEQAGSCGKYEVKCAGDAEMHLKRLSLDQAGYAIAANGKGFGCHRCPKGSKAFQPDSQGREIFCGDWDCRVFWNACCNTNGAEEVPLDDKGMPNRPKKIDTRGTEALVDSRLLGA
jgi:hypothetical protein